jgi:hypothetical protein
MRRALSALAAAAALVGAPAGAAGVSPGGITIDVPAGTANPVAPGIGVLPDPSAVYVDDVYLRELAFPGVTFAGPDSYRAAGAFEVLAGRSQVNVEWGDGDSGADGDPDPMTRVGQSPAAKETTDPPVQDGALRDALGSLSLTEMIDGEGGAASYKLGFSAGITDDSPGDAADGSPEIVLFERGRNDVFSLSLIVGGTFGTPVLSAPLEIDSATFADVGLRVDTTEIGGAQSLGVAGFDLDEWGIAPGASVFGYVYEGSGADLAGAFATGAPAAFVDPLPDIEPSVVPLPGGVVLLLSGLACACLLGRRRPA